MLKKLKQSDAKGFTIIEVMIVLAIAGLILAIVLFALPALNRSQRNTAIKNDASQIASGIAEYASNNDGAIPASGAGNSTCGLGTVTLLKSGGVASNVKIQGSTNVTCMSVTPVTAGTYDLGKIAVDFGYKCNGSTGASVTASGRSTAIVYTTEGSTDTIRCLDS